MEYNPSEANLRHIALIGLWALLGGFLKMVASFSNMAIGSPLFMDSIATAVIGALFGPRAGMLCAYFSHFFKQEKTCAPRGDPNPPPGVDRQTRERLRSVAEDGEPSPLATRASTP